MKKNNIKYINIKNPFHQLCLFGILILLAIFIGPIFLDYGAQRIMAAMTLFLFQTVNSIIGIRSEKWRRYTGISFLCFIIFFFLSILFPQIISSISISELRELVMVYTVVFYYPGFVLLGGTVRLIKDLIKNRKKSSRNK